MSRAGGGGGSIPISRLVSQVEVDVSGATRNLEQHRADLRDTGAATKQLGAEAGTGLAAGMEKAGTSIRQINNDLKAERQLLAELQQALQSMGGSGPGTSVLDQRIRETQEHIVALENELSKLGTETQNATRQMAMGFTQTVSSVEQLRQHLEALQQVQARGRQQGIFTPGLNEEINRTSAALRSMDAEVKNVGNSFQQSAEHVVRYAIAYQAIQTAKAIVGDLVQATIGLQTEMVKTAALTGVQASAIGEANQQIATTSRDTGIAAKELGAAYYFIASSGVAVSDSNKILEVSAKAAAAGLGETKTVADAVTSTLNAYKLSGDQAGRVTDVLVQAVKEGKGEASEFAASLGRVLPIAAQSGVTLEQAAASLAVMTRTGLSASEATTALRSTLGELERPGRDAQLALGGLGISADTLRQNIREKGLLATLTDLYQRTDGNVEVLGRIIPNIRALTGVLSTAGAQGEAYAQVLESMNNAQGSTQKAFETTAQSVDFQAKRVKTAFESMALGATDSLPAVSAFLGGFADGINDGSEKAATMQKAGEDAFGSWKKNLGDAIEANTKFHETIGPLPVVLESTKQKTNETSEGMKTMGQVMGGIVDAAITPMRVALRLLTLDFELAAAARAKFNETPIHPNEAQYNAARGGPTGLEGKETDYRSRPVPEGWDEQFTALYGSDEAKNRQQAAQIDYESIRRQAQGMAEVSSEARKLHDVLGDLWKLPADADPKVIEDKLKSLATAEATQEQAWAKAFDADEGGRRIGILTALTTEYTQAYLHGTAEQVQAAQERINAYLQEQGAADTAAAAQRKKDQEDKTANAEAKRMANEAAQAARAAHEADPLAGIRESLNKDRNDLVGVAGQVMADLENAVKLRGQQGARAAGEAFGNEARKWGEELEKAGLPGWEQAFNDLIARGQVAVVTGSPEIIRSIHDMLAAGEREVKEANVGRAVAEETARANTQMLSAQMRVSEQLANAQAQAGDARAQQLQSEVDREYSIWATAQVEKLSDEDKNGRELQRIRDEWGRQDADREEQLQRARQDREEAAMRAEQDRARANARSLSDMNDSMLRAQGDTSRARQREDRDAEYAHSQRLQQIATRGGPDAAKQIADENASYQEQQRDRTRRRSEDDAEAEIKRAQQVGDAQKRITEQTEDARIRAQEQAQDLGKRQQEQTDDLTKTRARQLQSRTEQEGDQKWLKERRLEHENQFFMGAEQQAVKRLQNELARIDARYEHEQAKAAETSEQIQLKRQHDIDAAEIRARAKEGLITPDQATGQLGALDETFTRQSAVLTAGLRRRETEIDARLRDTIAQSRQYAPDFAPQNVPFELTAQYTPPQPSFGKSDFSSIPGSLFAAQNAQKTILPLQFMGSGQQSTDPLPVYLPDQQIQEIIEGVGNLPPMEMDSSVVETQASRIRRQRNLSRVT